MKTFLQNLDAPDSTPGFREFVFSGCVLAFAILSIYGRTITFDFVQYDDPVYVSENPSVLFPSTERLIRLWTSPREGIYIPLSYTSFVAIGQVSKYETEDGFTAVDASVFHAVSIAVHFACSLMVWWLARYLVRNTLAALVAALLFACHPLQVESVAWVSGLSGQLGALFSLVAIYLFLRYVQSSGAAVVDQSRRTSIEWFYYALATIAFAGALLSKPQEVTVPLIAGLMAYSWHREQWRRIAISLAPWLLMALGLAMVTMSQQSEASITFVTPWWARPFILGVSLYFYIYKLVWPLELGPEAGLVPCALINEPWFYFAWMLSAAVLVAMVMMRAAEIIWVSAGIFVLALLPVLGLVPFAHQDISTVADRYVYLAMLGPALAVAGWKSSRRGPVHLSVVAILFVVLGCLSFVQAGYWRDTNTLANHVIQVNDRSWLMRGLKSHILETGGNEALAERELEIATEKLPESASPHYRLAVWRYNHGDYEGAMKSVRAVLDRCPAHPRALKKLGELYGLQGDFQRSYDTLNQALAIAPNDWVTRVSLAQLMLAAGRVDDAIAQYETIIAETPDHADALATLGNLLLEKGDLARAEALCRRAVVLSPEWDYAHASLGLVLLNTGNYGGAIRAFQTALRFQPDADEVRINLGVALINAGRLDEAEVQLRHAVDASPDNAAAHYNLGALLVRMNRLEEARALLQRALTLDPNHQQARIQLDALGGTPKNR